MQGLIKVLKIVAPMFEVITSKNTAKRLANKESISGVAALVSAVLTGLSVESVDIDNAAQLIATSIMSVFAVYQLFRKANQSEGN